MVNWIIMQPFQFINLISSQVQKGKKEERKETMGFGVLGAGTVRSLEHPLAPGRASWQGLSPPA